MTSDQIDKLILALAHPQYWRKVAFIIGKVGMSTPDLSQNYEAVAARIVALVAAGKLEAQGNLMQWRYSEIRLPQT